MSATFNVEDNMWLLNNKPNRKINDMEEALLLSAFDTETGQDIEIIKKEIKNIKFLKTVCVAKLLLFIPDYLLTFLLFTKQYRQTKSQLAKLYWKFLFNKINLENFRKQLSSLIKDGII